MKSFLQHIELCHKYCNMYRSGSIVSAKSLIVIIVTFSVVVFILLVCLSVDLVCYVRVDWAF